MWVEGDYICLYDADGRITGHFGIQRDITERKQAEEAVFRFNQRLRLLQQTDRAILGAHSLEETRTPPSSTSMNWCRAAAPALWCSIQEPVWAASSGSTLRAPNSRMLV